MAKLTVVPTPVGNLEDMTFRAIRVLKEADLILAEDTRTTGILLKHFEIQNRMQSHHKFNEHKTVEQVAARIKAGENIALVSDAGTPAISDPGFMLVRECVRQGVEVECLPGATAFVPALVASGLPNEKFCFEGFLPQKKGVYLFGGHNIPRCFPRPASSPLPSVYSILSGHGLCLSCPFG